MLTVFWDMKGPIIIEIFEKLEEDHVDSILGHKGPITIEIFVKLEVDHVDSILGYERTDHYRNPWKIWNSKQWFLLPISKAKFTIFIEWPRIFHHKNQDYLYKLQTDVENLVNWSDRWSINFRYSWKALYLVSMEGVVKLFTRMRQLSPLSWCLCMVEHCHAEGEHYWLARFSPFKLSSL